MTEPSSRVPFALTTETRNYRALHQSAWTPSGVCVVVGPNGAGKTTLLTLLEFLRNIYLRGAPSAIDQIGGVYGLRSWGARVDEPVVVALTVGDLRWELHLSVEGPSLSHRLQEKVMLGDQVILSAPHYRTGSFFVARSEQSPITNSAPLSGSWRTRITPRSWRRSFGL